MFNKPRGVLTTLEDPLGRPTVQDYLKKLPHRLFPVGRLDWDSEGLLILTNDGEYAQRITHPSAEVTKTYLVKVNGVPSAEQLAKLVRGVSIIGGRVRAQLAVKMPKGDSKLYSWVKVIITEGKNRQIRLMFEKIGFDVLKLQRIAIGKLKLGSVERGEIVFLNDAAAQLVFKNELEEAEKKRDKKHFVKRKKSTKRLYDKGKRIFEEVVSK